MSTPLDPQQETAELPHDSRLDTDSPAPREGAIPRRSDADADERPSTQPAAGHLPPVYAPERREPDAQFLDTAATQQQVRPGQIDQGPETLRYEAPQQDTVQHEPAQHLAQHGPTVSDEPLRAQPTVVGAPPDRQTVVAREHDRFGGMKFGSAFFGWLTATGLAVLLLAILAAAGVAFGVATSNKVDQAVSASQSATGTAKTVGLIGAIVLLVILFVAYYCGGYVAGRMARFDGVKQGLGVWIWALITSAVIAGVAAIAGAKYNVLAQLNLPRIPVDEGSVTTVGIIAIVAAILVALLGALLGGAVGTRYHRKVDAVGFEVDDATR